MLGDGGAPKVHATSYVCMLQSYRRPNLRVNAGNLMEELAELDEAAADALRRLFEHCDAAAAYVDDDLDVNGAAGWSRVDDGHGYAERGVLGRGPDTATLATYVHEREVAERCDDGERGGGGGVGSIPVESTARRSLGNVLRVLGASEASRRLVDGWLGLLDRARSARAARRRGEDVDFDVDDALAASVPQLYTGKDVREVTYRDVEGALVRRGGDGESDRSDDATETRVES